MRSLATVDLVSHLAACVVDQYLALSALNKHHEVGHADHDGNHEDGDQDAHGPGANQFQQSADGVGQARSNTGKDDDRDAVAQSALGDLLTQPHQEHRACGQADHRGHAEPETGSDHQARCAFQRKRNAHRLEQRQAQRAVARVLGDLAPACFAFLLHLFQRGNDVGQQLHDDGRRNVGHDAQREHREARQRATREHVEQAQYAALLSLEQLLQLLRVDAWHRDVRTHAVHHQRKQQKDESTTQVAVLACLCDLSRACCHLSVFQ